MDTKKYNSKGSSSSRAIYNPKDLLSFEYKHDVNDSQYNTFTTSNND